MTSEEEDRLIGKIIIFIDFNCLFVFSKSHIVARVAWRIVLVTLSSTLSMVLLSSTIAITSLNSSLLISSWTRFVLLPLSNLPPPPPGSLCGSSGDVSRRWIHSSIPCQEYSTCDGRIRSCILLVYFCPYLHWRWNCSRCKSRHQQL